MGQFHGGMTVMGDAFQNMARTFKTGESWTRSSKLDVDAKSRKARDLDIDREYEALKVKMNKDGVNGLVHMALLLNTSNVNMQTVG